MVTKSQINKLKDISYDILERDRLIHEYGLCKEIYNISKYTIDAYTLLQSILTEREYSNYLGPIGILNDKRKDILITFLAIPTDDLYEVLNHV